MARSKTRPIDRVKYLPFLLGFLSILAGTWPPSLRGAIPGKSLLYIGIGQFLVMLGVSFSMILDYANATAASKAERD